MGKADEQGYSYQETRDQKSIDIRNLILEIVPKSGCLQRLKQCHFDVLRVMSSYSSYETAGRDIPWTKIDVPNSQTEFSMTLYNIPPGRKYLTRSMLHLVQLHLNLNSLRLLEVPMKKSNNTKSSYEVNLLYPAGNHTPHNISVEALKTRIYEVDYLNYRQIVLKWVQRLHGLDQMATTCTHMVTPTEISPPTRALISSLTKGAIYALADASELSNNTQNESGKSIPFSHIILFRHDALYLHCQHINHGQNVHLEDAMYFNQAPPKLSTISKSVAPKNLMFFEKYIIRPNSIMNDRSYNYLQNVKNIQIPERKYQLIQTTSKLDIETRWLLSMLNLSSDAGIKLQIGLNDGNPVYEIISELKNLLCINIPRDDSAKIINEILDSLLTMGRRSDSFQDQKNANEVLKQMPLIAEFFHSSSPMHGEICDVILARIRPDGTENKQVQTLQPKSDTSNIPGSSSELKIIAKEEPKESQEAWQQLDQFNSMTYRERLDFLDSQESLPSPLQQVSQQTSTRGRSSSYRGRSGTQTLRGRRPRGYSHLSFGKNDRGNDDTVRHPPTPYLRIKPVDDKMIAQEKDNYMKKMSNTKSLLYKYWSEKQNDKFKGLYHKNFEPSLPGERNHKD